MKRNTNKYEELQTLPKNAMTVKQYADATDTTVNNIYNIVRRKKNNSFKIVTYQTINFIIPQ